MKKTKIVATIGPATESKEILKQLLQRELTFVDLTFLTGVTKNIKLKLIE